MNLCPPQLRVYLVRWECPYCGKLMGYIVLGSSGYVQSKCRFCGQESGYGDAAEAVAQLQAQNVLSRLARQNGHKEV